jgi:hypothetical protein
MTTTETKPDACPFCGHWLDRLWAGPGNPEATPRPGDVTICIKCGGLMILDPDLRVRPPTDDEQAEALADPQVSLLITAVRMSRKEGEHGNDA